MLCPNQYSGQAIPLFFNVHPPCVMHRACGGSRVGARKFVATTGWCGAPQMLFALGSTFIRATSISPRTTVVPYPTSHSLQWSKQTERVLMQQNKEKSNLAWVCHQSPVRTNSQRVAFNAGAFDRENEVRWTRMMKMRLERCILNKRSNGKP